MHRSTTLFLIGLCLIAIIGFNFFVVQTSALIGAVIIIGVVFIAGAITGYFVCKSTTSTRYEAGVDKSDYIYNVAVTWHSQINNTETFSFNQGNLSGGIRYYWFRKAEHVSQYYINESTFPKEKVAEESGIKGEYFNLTGSLLDSYDNVLASENSFFASTLPAFDTLDAKAFYNTSSGTVSFSLKGKNVLGLFQYLEGNTQPYEISGYYHHIPSDKLYIGAMLDVHDESGGTYEGYIKIYDSNNTLIKQYNITFPDAKCALRWVKVEGLTEGEKYKISYSTTQSGKIKALLVPICFIPEKSDDLKNFCVSTVYNFNSSSAFKPRLSKIVYYSDSTPYYTLKFKSPDAFPSLSNAIKTHADNYQDALSAGQAYWTLLRTLGYYDYDDIPRNYYIPPPSVVDIGSDVTEKLTPEQLYALYIAYLKALEQFFTSETYRESNVTSIDVKVTDFSLVVNCTAYNSYGNVTLFDKKMALIMPTTDSLTLERGKNNTLTQTVNVVYFDNSTLENETINYIQLKPNDILYVHEFYKDGEFYNASSVTIDIIDLKQLSFKYDFTLRGEPTYAYTEFQDWIPIIIAVLVISMIIAVVDKSRKRR